MLRTMVDLGGVEPPSRTIETSALLICVVATPTIEPGLRPPGLRSARTSVSEPSACARGTAERVPWFRRLGLVPVVGGSDRGVPYAKVRTWGAKARRTAFITRPTRLFTFCTKSAVRTLTLGNAARVVRGIIGSRSNSPVETQSGPLVTRQRLSKSTSTIGRYGESTLSFAWCQSDSRPGLDTLNNCG